MAARVAKKTVEPMIEESEVEQPVETVQAPVTFLSIKYPSLRILISRNPSKSLNDKDKYARFMGGALTTNDPEIIAKLDKCPDVQRDTGQRYTCPNCQYTTRHILAFSRHMASH